MTIYRHFCVSAAILVLHGSTYLVFMNFNPRKSLDLVQKFLWHMVVTNITFSQPRYYTRTDYTNPLNTKT